MDPSSWQVITGRENADPVSAILKFMIIVKFLLCGPRWTTAVSKAPQIHSTHQLVLPNPHLTPVLSGDTAVGH